MVGIPRTQDMVKYLHLMHSNALINVSRHVHLTENTINMQEMGSKTSGQHSVILHDADLS